MQQMMTLQVHIGYCRHPRATLMVRRLISQGAQIDAHNRWLTATDLAPDQIEGYTQLFLVYGVKATMIRSKEAC